MISGMSAVVDVVGNVLYWKKNLLDYAKSMHNQAKVKRVECLKFLFRSAYFLDIPGAAFGALRGGDCEDKASNLMGEYVAAVATFIGGEGEHDF